MTSTKGRLIGLIGSWVLTDARVQTVVDAGPNFRVVELRCEDNTKRYEPGDKLQFLLPSKDMRTYTPIGWNDGTTRVLAYVHSERSPAARWLRGLRDGDSVRFVGPQRSLSLPAGKLVFIGDETAIGVAAAYARARPGQVDARFEVAAKVEVEQALASVKLDAPIARRDAKQTDALLEGIDPDATVAIVGGSEMVKRLRAALRERGHTRIKAKAYWIPGRAGLD